MKSLLLSAVDRHRDLILETERQIWRNPETGFREWKTHRWLAEKYEGLGYRLTPAGNIPGFITELDTGRPGPTVCILGELDSLICMDHPDADPVTGAVHACGHNAQSAALLGIAAALREPGALDGMSGKIRLMVVPAEELIELEYRQSLYEAGVLRYLGGKVEFLARGLFDGVDIAFMLHTCGDEKPGFHVTKGGNGCLVKNIEYIGVAEHASNPLHAVNALYAANLGMNAVNALRETFPDGDHIRFHPIVTHGGTVVNAIPSSVSIESYVRGANLDAISRENAKINRALAGAAVAVGARVRLHDTPGYSPLINDPTLSGISAEAFADVVGARNVDVSDEWSTGCTDMGDISAVMPAVHQYVCGATGTGHGNDYFITNPEAACVDSAKGQLLLLDRLLSNDAAEARRVLANAKPLFPSFAAFLAAIDRLRLDVQPILYEGSSITIKGI